jgi:hypothetical protein
MSVTEMAVVATRIRNGREVVKTFEALWGRFEASARPPRWRVNSETVLV